MDWDLVGGVAGLLAAALAAISVGQNWRAARRSTERNDVRWSIFLHEREIVVGNDGQDVAGDVRIEVSYVDNNGSLHHAEVECEGVAEESVRTGVILPPVPERSEYDMLAPRMGPDQYVHWTITWRSKRGRWATMSGQEAIYDP